MPIIGFRLQHAMSSIQESYGRDHLELTVIRGYVKRLLANARVVSYLLGLALNMCLSCRASSR
ncbi:plasmid partitioning protein RepB C-terminal domain-containing protein [Phyllobacterium sp. 1468]|uniref:plasmid partitioning protein RepB C-terminal domain-containing protein n=1 Tax=Phyllobacterium sp. 1468 TaxID=2817759 RepID=UPI0038620DF9